MTGAVRALQWTIQDLNGAVEHLGQSHDSLRRSYAISSWAMAIFAALLLSALVWVANDVFHLKDQLNRTEARFDGVEGQLAALGARIDGLNGNLEQLSAQLAAGTGPALVSRAAPQPAPADDQPAALDAAIAPPAADPAAGEPDPAVEAPPLLIPGPDGQTIAAVEPSPPAPREDLTPAEIAAATPPAAALPATEAPAPAAAAAPAATPQSTAEVTPAAAPAPAQPAAPAASNLSDDQLLGFDDDQIDPADELLLLDENGN
jgi:hypothetical protein